MANDRGGRRPARARRTPISFNILDETKAALTALAAEEYLPPATLGAMLLDEVVAAYAETRDASAAAQAATAAVAGRRPRPPSSPTLDPPIRSLLEDVCSPILALIKRCEHEAAAALERGAPEAAMGLVECARETRGLRRAIVRLALGRAARDPEAAE